jgi:hypothetical protein
LLITFFSVSGKWALYPSVEKLKSGRLIKGKTVIVHVPEDTSAAAVNIRTDLCGRTEVSDRDVMDGSRDI